MKKKITSLLLLAFSALAFASCKKYLDLRPDKSLAVPTTVADLQALLDNQQELNNNSPNYDIFSCDEYIATPAIYNAFSLNRRKAWIWENYEYLYGNDWSNIYDPIYYCNVVLAQVNSIERNDANSASLDNVRGSALVFRSMSYLRALWIFSKAYDESTAALDYGIALRTSPDFNQPVIRESVAICYNTLIDELKTAATLLPATPVHPLRPSKAAAYGFLARAYLSMRIYDSAFRYADLSLGIKSDLLDYNTTDIAGLYPFGLFVLNKEIIMSQQVGVNVYGGGTNLRVDPAIYDSHDANDLRKQVNFRIRPDGYIFKGTYSGAYSPQFTGLATNEMYLMRAECYARQGKTDEAMTDLNKVLENRFVTGTFVPFAAANAAEALEMILFERRRELFSRGLRWMDIKRLNKEGAGIVLTRTVNSVTYTLQPNENRYALPLPTDIINLTGMPQNPI